jgi:hypothetical protein
MTFRTGVFLSVATLALAAACGGPDTQEPLSAESETVEVEANSDPASPEDMDPASGEDDSHVAGTRAADTPAPDRLDAHEHGHATLAVTVQDDTLVAAFDAPLASFGVTEDPQTREDEAEIEALEIAFGDETQIITLGGDVGCRVNSRSTGTRITSGHGELQIEYSYSCNDIDALKSIRLNAFEAYPALSQIDAIYVSDTDQIAAELSGGAPEMKVD